MKQSEPILVVGSGAMACLFAARLSAAGFSVTMLGSWLAAIDAINRDGIRVLDEKGNEKGCPALAASDFSEIKGIKLAFVLVKAYQTRAAAEKLSACLADDGLAVSIQNGLGNLNVMAGILGEERCAGGATTLGATLLMPGMIRPHLKGEVYLASHPRLEPALTVLGAAGFSVQVRDDLDSLVWGKLVVNCAANPLSVLLEMTNGEIATDPSARKLAALLANEAAGVARALNIQLPYPDPAAQVEKVLLDTAANRTSMFQDYHRGAPGSEIDAINGAVVEAAAKLGISVPYNEAVTLLVKACFNLQNGKVNLL